MNLIITENIIKITLKQFLLLTFLLFSTSFCYADEPPSWSPYKRISENKKFFCWIDYADKDTSKYPWERKWNLKIFSNDSTLVWKRDFNHSGYEDGILSNDGNSFIIVQYWYHESGNVVEVFNRNFNDYFLKGREFKIPTIFLKTTTSHKLWIKNYQYKDNKILIETNDSNIWEIDVANREIKFKKSNLFYIEAIAISIGIVLLIIFITYKRRK